MRNDSNLNAILTGSASQDVGQFTNPVSSDVYLCHARTCGAGVPAYSRAFYVARVYFVDLQMIFMARFL